MNDGKRTRIKKKTATFLKGINNAILHFGG
jgi:hypothetical protein